MLKVTIRVAVCFLCIVFVSGLYAQDLQIHGFVSQGYMKSSDYDWLVNSKEGSFEFNEAAVNFSIQLTDKLRGGLQLFSRNLGPTGDNNVVLDWGYLDYTLKDWLGLQAGKIKTPFGLYNQIRDVDMLRTSVLMPSGVYYEGMRDFLISFEGASVYGNVGLSALGDVDYEAFVGAPGIDPYHGYFNDFIIDNTHSMSFIILYKMGMVDPVTGQVTDNSIHVAGSDNSRSVTSKIWGGSLKLNIPLGLRAGISYAVVESEMNTDMVFYGSDQTGTVQFTAITPMTAKVKMKNWYVASLEWTLNNLVVAGEYMRLTEDTQLSTYSVAHPLEKEGYYLMGDYRFSDVIAIGGYYSFYQRDKEDYYTILDGNQQDYCLTTKFNLTPHWTLKLEGHYIDGTNQLPVLYTSSYPEETWNLFAVKTTFNF